MYQVNTNAKVTFENCYVIGNTIKLYDINKGSVIGGDNVLYTNNPQDALTAITTAGLTAANGWNTNIWAITDSGDLTFNNNVVIKKA